MHNILFTFITDISIHHRTNYLTLQYIIFDYFKASIDKFELSTTISSLKKFILLLINYVKLLLVAKKKNKIT